MSHIGTSTDWSECDCTWSASGPWAHEEALSHEVEYPGHETRGGVSIAGPIGSEPPVCETCQAVNYLRHWFEWSLMWDQLWHGWPDDESEPPEAEVMLCLKPTAPLRWLEAIGDWDSDNEKTLLMIARNLTCRFHGDDAQEPR